MKGYFEGWYFRCVSDKAVAAFIPAYHINGDNKSFSLQIITDDDAIYIPLEHMEYTTRPLCVRTGKSVFSEDGICIDISYNDIHVNGNIRFGELASAGSDIMGPFRYVPFLQCRHSIFSMRHSVCGCANICGKEYVFENSVGYIEGDRGHSFPERYIWTQCVEGDTSLMLSVADIPFMGSKFTGIIGVVLTGNKRYRFATYLGAKVKELTKDSVTVVQGDTELAVKLINNPAHPLKAPAKGVMERTIYESASCTAYYRLSKRNRVLCEFISERAGFEFEY